MARSCEDFVAAMGDLLKDPSHARALGAAGRERTLREFSWESVARSYVDLFTNLEHAA